MGQAVYTAANENIGEINDLIMNKDLDNIVAIVGVGGFLGIGEKDVAIPIGDIQVVKDAEQRAPPDDQRLQGTAGSVAGLRQNGDEVSRVSVLPRRFHLAPRKISRPAL